MLNIQLVETLGKDCLSNSVQSLLSKKISIKNLHIFEGVSWVDDLNDEDLRNINKAYNKDAITYADTEEWSSQWPLLLKRKLAHFYELIPIQQSKFNIERFSILDVGCGSGRFIQVTAEKFPAAKVIGFDNSTGIIKQAKQRLKEFNLGNNVWVDNILSPSLTDSISKSLGNSSLKAIIANGSFPHIPKSSSERVLQTFYTLLEPGGVLSFGEKYSELGKKFYDKIIGSERVFSTMSIEEVGKLLFIAHEIGFEFIEISAQKHYYKEKPIWLDIFLRKP